ETYGRFASGKSQLGFQLIVNVHLPRDKGGLDGGALVIDTEGTFRPDRIEQLSKAAGLDPKQVLDNILVVRATSTDQQILAIERADKLVREDNVKLIIVDSLMALFRSEFLGRGALGERQQKLNAHIHKLQRLADTYDLAVYITNQVMDNPGILFGDPTTPVGGNVVAHAATTRLYMRKSKEEKRIIRLVDSPNMPEGEAIMKITPDGIKD
ncbi:MAG: DNA repair and recombination protein RadA, partial [Candidatus Micrarchaeota archaeon]|nr:DNA repair and recombination protein RadA [Candidatus Micrarchaeota archaeon]